MNEWFCLRELRRMYFSTCLKSYGFLRRRQTTYWTQVYQKSVLAYEIFQPVAEPTKNMLIMHGILGNKLNWRSFAKRLAQAHPQYRIVTADLRGHGDSMSMEKPHTLETCARDLMELLRHLHLRSFDVVVGHSFGGKVSLSYLLQCLQQHDIKPPQQTWILDSFPGSKENDHAHRFKGEHVDQNINFVLQKIPEIPTPILSTRDFLDKAMVVNLPRPIALWLTTNLRQINDPTTQYIWKPNFEVIKELFQDYLEIDYWPVLTYANIPTKNELHFVAAEKNETWKNNGIKQKVLNLMKIKENVKLHVIQNSGHWIHVDNPDGLFELFNKHLK